MKILIALISLLMLSSPAWAILGVGDIVSDPATEANTAATVAALGIANAALAAIQASDAAIALSVTTPGDPGLYQGVSQYLDSLNGQLTGAGVSPAAMATDFPGWMPIGPYAIPQNKAIATMGLGTYQGAVQSAQAQAADFDAENTYLSSIESANVSVTGVLAAIQINTEAQLATASQIQMLRQLIVALVTVESLRSAEELNERSQAGATTAQAMSGGVPPQ